MSHQSIVTIARDPNNYDAVITKIKDRIKTLESQNRFGDIETRSCRCCIASTIAKTQAWEAAPVQRSGPKAHFAR